MNKTIYLDSAATTPLCESAKKVIVEHLDNYYNANSLYDPARKLRIKVESARESIAEMIGAKSADEIYFTSGGSEANSWLTGQRDTSKSNIEHSSVVGVSLIKSNNNGIIDTNCVRRALDSGRLYLYDTFSIMHVNNELGTINPIKDNAQLVHECKLLIHSDAVQSVGHLPINVQDIGLDMMSASGHKFNAPKGIGFAYIKNEIKMPPMIHGGSQERSIRGGTTNAVSILAMEAALKESITYMDERNAYTKTLRDKLLNSLLNVQGVKLNGSYDNRVVSNINVCIDGVNAQDMVAECNEYGILISAGSACHEGSATPSHVLKAIGLSNEEANSSVRLTLSHFNTMDEIDYCCKVLPNIIKTLR